VAANGSPAVAAYRVPAPGLPPTAFAIQVLDVDGGRIAGIHVFLDRALFARFGLPSELEGSTGTAPPRR